MKLKSPTFAFRLTKLTFLTFALSQSTLAAITVTFIEEAAGVRITFNGTLSVDPTIMDDTSISSELSRGGLILNTTVLGQNGSAYSEIFAGTATSTSLGNIDTSNQPGDVGNFGFSGGSIAWGAEHISGGSVGAVSELTATPANASFFVPGATLVSLNADPNSIAQGATLWTATNTGDTFTFASHPVPEPSSVCILSFGALVALRRRR